MFVFFNEENRGKITPIRLSQNITKN